jgi:hypothetical protein
MQISRFMFYVAICAMSFVVTVPASSKQAPWGWFSASSTGSNWSVVEGKADVSISPSSFFAQLHSSNAFLMVTLKGTVLDRKVVARATFHGTDKPSATLIGKLRRLCWNSGGGRELLVLTDGLEVISIARDLPSNQSCLPAN